MPIRIYRVINAETAASPCLLGLKGGEPQTAEAAYRIADAMLAERKKENNDADR